MNTTRKGDALEDAIAKLFGGEIAADLFWAKKEFCTLCQKKGYYSRDRGSNIVFDVSIEVRLPASTGYSLLVLIECKNYSHPVGVAELEEFFTKIQQVAGANCKGILATTSTFQPAALAFAKSKGIGLLRYFEEASYKWELYRSPSAAARPTPANDDLSTISGLLRENFRSVVFDLIGFTNRGATHSLNRFCQDLLKSSKLGKGQTQKILNKKSEVTKVPFIEKTRIEEIATKLLKEISHQDGEVRLENILDIAYGKKTVTLKRLPYSDENTDSSILGSIDFESFEILIYGQPPGRRGRERFTLAHELGHIFLNHQNYLRRERCFEDQLDPANPGAGNSLPNIVRMEWQANYFATCLLMPRDQLKRLFKQSVKALDIPDRGHGGLFVDSQPCNLDAYYSITNLLKGILGVSRAAIFFRLQELELVKDARPKPFNPVQRILLGMSEGRV